MITGWRCWDISPNGHLWSPLNYGGDVEWPPGPMRAVCEAPVTRERHPVPDPECSCGFRSVPDLGGFCTVILWGHKLFLPKVVGLARIGGRTCAADAYGDPGSAIRAEWAAVAGPLHLGQPFAAAAPLLAGVYGADVILSDTDQLDWMSGAIAGDHAAWTASPASLGQRLYRPNREARRRAAALMRRFPR